MLIMGIIILIWLNMQNSEITYTAGNILLFAAILFIVGTAMDYFNQCYTTCKNMGSSITFGAFTVAIIYLFFGLFVSEIEVNFNLFIAFVLNTLIIAGLHYVTCDDIHKDNGDDRSDIMDRSDRTDTYVIRNNFRRQYYL